MVSKSDISSNFPGAYLKVERANKHIDELKGMIAPLSPDFYTISWQEGRDLLSPVHFQRRVSDPDFINRMLVYDPKKNIGNELALIIGDAIHNLRAALDYAATAVVREAGLDTRFVTFPFHEKRDKLVSPQHSGMRKIEEALPGADIEGFFRDTIKPYRDGNLALWSLTKLDKIDKHNFIIPTVTIFDINTGNISGLLPGMVANQNIMSHNANEPYCLFSGPVNRFAKVQDDIEVSVEVTFPQDSVLGAKSVFDSLVEQSEIVFEALNSFDRFVHASSP